MKRCVKIVATLGPASEGAEGIEKLLRAGVNVLRLNFSHGRRDEYENIIKTIRKVSKQLDRPAAILQDLQGPKIRVGALPDTLLKKNQLVCLYKPTSLRSQHLSKKLKSNTSLKNKGAKKHLKNEALPIEVDFKHLPAVCKKGTRILLDDGRMELCVQQVQPHRVLARVVTGGVLKSRKGINVPGVNLPVQALTRKDLSDLQFGLTQGVDYVALSFVRTAQDIEQLRRRIRSYQRQHKRDVPRIVAKIEMLEALDNLEAIVEASDAVMVARGDLSVEAGQSQLPLWQKQIIRLSNERSRPVITATQMLDSMINNRRPTRAEITDVANAVLDGSDALMLSAETATGQHPSLCVQTMHDISLEVERTGGYYYDIPVESDDTFISESQSIACSASLCAMKLNAKAIVCLTTTGHTASMIASYRPRAQIIAVTHRAQALNQLALVWGLQTYAIRPYQSLDEALKQIKKILLENKIVRTGEKIILTLGLPIKKGAKTNSMRVYTL